MIVYYIKITPANAALSAELGVTVSSDVRPMESLGLAIQGIVYNNLAEDTCNLSWIRDIGEAPPFLADDVVEISSSEEGPMPHLTRLFLGRVVSPDCSVGESDISVSYTLNGPFYDLRRHIFSRTPTGIGEINVGDILTIGDQTVQIANDIGVIDFFETPVQVPPGYVIDTRGHLFDPLWPPIPPRYRLLQDQVEELLQYVVDRLDDEPGGLTFQFDRTNWNLGADLTPKFRTFQDRNVADLLVEALSVKPDAAIWFDYTQSPPMLHLDKASELEPISFALGEPPLVSLRGKPRNDLVVAGVVIRYDWSEWGGAGYNRGWCPCYQVDNYPLSCKADDPGVLCMTLVDYDIFTYATYAEEIYKAMNVLRFAGSVTFYDPDRELSLHPGTRLTITGDHAAMQYGELLIQTAAWNANTGEWSISTGLPPILGIQTMRELRGWLQICFSGPGYAFSTRLPSPNAG